MAMRSRSWLLLLLAMALATAAYRPGLAGDYLFDDFPNVVDNPDIRLSAPLSWHQLVVAAQASPSAELRRPLAMLSFAANYYFSGLDPWPMKAVNLGIHLLNGFLLWRVVLALLVLWRRERAPHTPQTTLEYTALGIACAWLLAPVNLSSVLYVVQRMESLAQVFVLGGLWLYLEGRRRILDGAGTGAVLACACGLAGGSALGALCKESAVLLPLYAFLVEALLLRFAAPRDGARRALWVMFGVLLFVPAIAGLAWLLPRTLPAAAYAERPFTLGQRLLTECRVLADYLQWILLPHPSTLSFYHDDIPLSRGWIDPPATLGCAALLAAAIAAALALRRRLPLFALGVAWYFAAHLLTATIIPLELAFEHRNYFASIGALLAAASLVLAIPPRLASLRAALPLLWIAVFAAVTWLRASEWRDPIQFAYTEAAIHPLSPRANYELGRTLVVASAYRPGSKLIEPAVAALERAGGIPGSGAAPWSALIVVAGHMKRQVQPRWWAEVNERLAAQPPSNESISALESLTACQHDHDCPEDTPALLAAFLAALRHPPSGRLLAAYGVFAANQMHDYVLAASALADAAALLPETGAVRVNLVKVLLLQGDRQRAQQALDALDGTALNADEARLVAQYRELLGATRRDR